MRLFKAISTLLALAVMAALVADKVANVFPAIDPVGWFLAIATLVVVVLASIAVEPVVTRLPLGWINANESRRQYFIIFCVGLVVALVIIALWPLVGGLIGPHFGEAV